MWVAHKERKRAAQHHILDWRERGQNMHQPHINWNPFH